ncbi:hypothetical protein ENUP19_0085G0011 [Entamoeba nuttalli]|uniref:Plasma membrane proteolipid 3 n=2 Tax=Entamoeba nuttalli TaxID=412467 RepID=K2GFU1_ENTNP|nr:hypothetical protein ENU1_050970 [Entamoeba nuttalli P19]EKE41571.1 hypothetical protein ENU1_050970 [Entamoeba nuttalli P19]|eukprot:XP_008856080.1 hypothetical protein ENU1_050970 [Entamoeba nuttalli P19]
MGCVSCVLLIILAFIFPPLAVLIKADCGFSLCLNIILTLICWIPGVIHAIYVVITD